MCSSDVRSSAVQSREATRTFRVRLSGCLSSSVPLLVPVLPVKLVSSIQSPFSARVWRPLVCVAASFSCATPYILHGASTRNNSCRHNTYNECTRTIAAIQPTPHSPYSAHSTRSTLRNDLSQQASFQLHAARLSLLRSV